MKTANLLMSVAIASVMIANPATVETADAVKIKIKVDVSNGHNAKVKPRIRIKPKITAAKAATKVKVKRKKKLANKINPAPKPAEEAQIASAGSGKKNSKLAAANSRGQSRYVELPEITDVLPTFRIDFAAGQEAAEAARAAAELKDLIELGALRDAASPDFGLASPDLARDFPSNAERLGETGFERRTGGMFPGDDLGSGPGGFGTLSNSHNRDTPNNRWGVNVSGLGDGILSTRTTTTHTEGNTIFTKTVDTEDGTVTTSASDPKIGVQKTVGMDDTGVTIQVWNSGRGSAQYHNYTYENGVIRYAHHDYADHDGNHTHHSANYETGWSHWTRNGEQFHQYRILQDPRDFRRNDERGGGINRMTDPDYVGGSSCNNIGCILNGGGGLKPLDGSKLTAAHVLPAGPDEDNGGISASGTPMYTSNDVLERYDEDSRRRDEFRQANPDDFCFHSEC